ncbi:MAG: prepilin-type N-terminal cleavage/methylation domain-containing protein [Phycisphaeraceae bacterium]|nr:prepilin-type N-terminal cleavage/methylation domain-containing protein [Phycisphaeraceae bacterium]
MLGRPSKSIEPAVARQRRAFTLIELALVVAIIAALIALLLPALRGARRAANAVVCQSNLKQIGMGIRAYLDEQGDGPEVFLDLHPRNRRFADRWNAMVLLDPFLSGPPDSGVFACPEARGASSVLDPMVRLDMERRAGKFQVFDFDGDGVEEYTEYWFNDSLAGTYRDLFGDAAKNPAKPLGVSGQDLSRLEHRDAIVWAADAVDWIPRHEGRTNLLLGDESVEVRSLRPPDYLLYEARDFWGAPGPFYNWGHFYPDRYGP